MFTDFIINDPRKDRGYVTITEESLTKRCEAMLPAELVSGKNILDVGCALGAMGQWALAHGSSSYTGVEIQDTYRDKSKELLSNFDNVKLYKFLDDVPGIYDIVIAAGVINGIEDQLGFLRKLSLKSSQYIIIDMTYLPTSGPVIKVVEDGKMIKYQDVNSPYTGVSFLPSIQALTTMMKVCGFQFNRRIIPLKVLNSHDPYNNCEDGHGRCIVQYQKVGENLKSLEENIRNSNVGI